MPAYVAFLRAVNVGGRVVRMQALREALEASGFGDVQTHIQSGNVRVSTPLRSAARVEERLERVLGECAGFDVPVMVRTPSGLRALTDEVAGIPPLLDPPGRRYVAVAKTPVTADAARALTAYEATPERAAVVRGDVLLELGVGFREAKLPGARLERLAGTAVTARDLGVLDTLAERWGA
ncbi:MAG TPA: DUF1697 domain-containing protein [Dermatophilaceae bacterium]|nr:DUF1697 domain-containing protein [Dermatophilaceae bacterium]